jgi:hypothetical protein
MITETCKRTSKWTIRRYLSEDFDRLGFDAEPYHPMLPPVSEFEGNCLLNEGIAEMIDLLIGETATAFSNANAYLGVGDSDTAAAADQTALQAVTNKTYKAMETGYPTNASQTVTFRSVFGGSDANYAWKEFTAINGSDDTGDNLNRKVSDQGTKASGQTWTLDLEITFS